MATNTFLNTDEITLEALDVLENSLGFTKTIRRKYDSYFAVSGAKIGDTLRVRKPAKYLGSYGAAYNAENIVETHVPVVLNKYFKVHMEMTTSDLTLRIDEFSNRILKPAVSRIANKIDEDGLALASQVSQSVGTPGVAITSPQALFNAQAKLDNAAALDDGDRACIMDPQTVANLCNGMTNFFNPQSDISRQFRRGRLGELANFDCGKDQNVARITTGTYGGTPRVNGPNQTGSTFLMKGWTATTSTLQVGDVFQIAGVYAVNPANYQQTGQLMDFTVTALATADGSGNMSVSISPAIVTTGATKNVSQVPPDNALISIYGQAAANLATVSGVSTPVNIAYHPDFITVVSADLYKPEGTDKASRKSDDQLGFSIRYIRDYDGTTDTLINRLDILYGWAILRPELACRIHGV